MENRNTNNGFFKPLDINLTLLIKYISDWSSLLKKISPFASIIFVCLNLRSVFSSKKALITILLLIPALIITPGSDILRLILSACILWIFLDKFNEPYQHFSLLAATLVGIYSVVIFVGIFFPEFYLEMGGGALRYKFILESHNALSILVFMFFVYLCNTLLMLIEKKAPSWQFAAFFIPFLLLIFTFLFIKSRLYIGLTFLLITFVAIKNYKKSKLLAVTPVIYLTLFILLSRLSINLVSHPVENPVAVQTIPAAPSENKSAEPSTPGGTKPEPSKTTTAAPNTSPSKTVDTPATQSPDYLIKKKLTLNDEGNKVIDNTRVLNLNSTGRWPMIEAFFELFAEQGWESFIYQNNTAPYFEKKKKLPSIDVTASTLTENTYLVIFLYTGFLGLFTFLFIFGYFALTFFKRKEFLSLAYFLFLLAVWFFEETVMFPFSMITHLFALATINRIERKQHEGSPDH